MAETKYFAVVRWTAQDVMAIAKGNGVLMTFEQAESWLENHENGLKQALTQIGNEMLEDLLYKGL